MQPLLHGAPIAASSPSYVITPNDVATLVSLSEAHGIDPIDVAAVLYLESAGFNPASLGPGGLGNYTGLNQMSVANLSSFGIAPADWVTYSAAEQLPYVFKFWQSLQSFNNGAFPQNAAVLAALNLLPGNYKMSGAASNPNAPIASNPSIYYTKNTYYDPDGTGSITLNTIAKRMAMIINATAPRWQGLKAAIIAVDPSSVPLSSQVPSENVASKMLTAIAGGLAVGAAAHYLLPPTSVSKRRRRYA